MKPMSKVSESNNFSEWLGFSLSPNLNNNNHNMELSSSCSSSSSSTTATSTPVDTPHLQCGQTQLTSALTVSTSTDFQPQTHLISYGNCFLYGGENVGCGSYSTPSSTSAPLSVMMPLKSDGSLCLMEALTSSQQTHNPQAMGTTSAPKVGAHSYLQNQARIPFMPSGFKEISLQEEEEEEEHQIAAFDSSSGDNSMQNPRQQYYYSVPGLQQQGYYGDFHPLSLSMSPGSQSSSCITTPHQQISSTATVAAECLAVETKKRVHDKSAIHSKQVVHRKSIDTFGQRTSQYRGVTRHRWTGRYEAHLWDNSCKKEGQTRKGRQVYLGGYDMEEKAARAYDLAALKYWGPPTHINFPPENYQQELVEMKNMTRQEYVAHLRRKSSGFSRGASIYRGVTRHHQHGRWQARIGRVAGNKDLYLGTFSTQEEAAEAYDIAAIKFRGINAVTNFDITRYDVERIMASNTLLAGELARRNNKESSLCHAGDLDQIALIEDGSNNETLCLQGAGDFKESSSAREDRTERSGAPSSNSPSLMTSLSSSREGNSERSVVVPVPFGGPPSWVVLG